MQLFAPEDIDKGKKVQAGYRVPILSKFVSEPAPLGPGYLPTSQTSSSALSKMLLTEGIIEDDDYAVLRRGLAARNAIAHGFLNQSVDADLFEKIGTAAKELLHARKRR